MSEIRPGILARTRFWRSRTAGEGADLEWCCRMVHVGRKIPAEALPAKYRNDDADWYAITFMDGAPPETPSIMGDPPQPCWPWPARGLVPA